MIDRVISAETLIQAFGKSSNLESEGIDLINLLATNRKLASQVNRLLLEQGEKLCPLMNEELFSALSSSLESSIGMGKGVFMSTLMYMSERFARIRLSLWLKSDGCLDTISTHYRQGVLTYSMQMNRHSLANDIAHWMESLGESASVQMSLSRFDRESLALANLDEFLPEIAHVDILCRSRAYMQALTSARQESSISLIRRAMAKELGTQDYSWRGLLQELCQKLSGDVYDTDTIINKYKSVGTVLVSYLHNMDEKTRKSELLDDDLRVMAFKLGIESVIDDMESPAHKKAALVHGLSL
ncbi:hypothetical protein P5704_025485 (plasmid) [Pseudomonas sp. FeN3W]|nr:hypothetical protein P5704_025485 [Pseudomonas sp. FeN3W]